jgi:hypothetical protein
MTSFKVKMIFPCGIETNTAEFKDTDSKPCLTDSRVQAVTKHFLREHNKTCGMVLIWGHGKTEFCQIIHDQKLTDPQLEAVLNGAS